MTDTSLEIGTDIRNKTLYRDIIENCVDAVIVVDADQTITYANNSAAAMFGRSNDGLAGKPLHILIPTGLRTTHQALVESFRDSNEPARFMKDRTVPIHGLRADGLEFPVNVSILKSGTGSSRSMVAIIRDITEQKKLEEELNRLASIDPLTGVLNRRAFLSRAEEEYARALRYGRPMTLAMIDIDRFKAVNDAFGHLVGDQAIRHIVKAVSSGLRKTDVLCRWGGEEFALILTETDENSALLTTQRLRRSVEESPFKMDEAREEAMDMTISIGVSSLKTADESLDALINRADQALYAAKRTGRNKVCAIDSSQNENTDAA